MKKQLLNLSACAVFLALAAYVFADPLVAPVRTLEIPFANTGEITIDGLDDEAMWSGEQSTDAFNPTGSTGADPDFTFAFKVAFNPQYLFLYGEVLDDFDNSVEYTTTGNPWEYDNIEVFINLDTVGSLTATYDSNTIQLRINRGIDSVQTPGRAAHGDYILHTENTGSGWLTEAAIPWTCVLGTGQLPQDMDDYLTAVHGFDMSGADSDELGPGHRDCQTAWDNDDPDDPADRTEDGAWNNRLVFGIITLADASAFVWPNNIENVTDGNLGVYPNPANNTINIDIDGLQTVEIYNIAGVQVKVVETTGVVDISDLNSGLYLVRVGDAVARIVVE